MAVVFNNLAENCYSSAISSGFLSDKKTCNAGLHHTDGAASFADLAFEVGLKGRMRHAQPLIDEEMRLPPCRS